MTAGELIALLQKVPTASLVYVEDESGGGYEVGAVSLNFGRALTYVVLKESN